MIYSGIERCILYIASKIPIFNPIVVFYSQLLWAFILSTLVLPLLNFQFVNVCSLFYRILQVSYSLALEVLSTTLTLGALLMLYVQVLHHLGGIC